MVTQRARVLRALQGNKRGLTDAQMKGLMKIGCPGAEVYRLRIEGHPIELEKRVDTKGRKKSFYVLKDTAPREVIAAGYYALAKRLVTFD